MEHISELTFISGIANMVFVAITILGMFLIILALFNFSLYIKNPCDYNFSLSKIISYIFIGSIMTITGYNMSTEPEKTGQFLHDLFTTNLGLKIGIFALITLFSIAAIFFYLNRRTMKQYNQKIKEINSLEKKEETIKEELKPKSIISNF